MTRDTKNVRNPRQSASTLINSTQANLTATVNIKNFDFKFLYEAGKAGEF